MKIHIIRPFYFLSFLILTVFTNCNQTDDFETEQSKTLTLDLSGEMFQLSTNTLTREGASSNYFSRVDSITIYGFGVQQVIPDSLKNFDLKFIFSGKMRNTESTNGYISLSLYNSKDSILIWDDIVAEKHIAQLNTWTPFKDSLIIKQAYNNYTAEYVRIFTRKILGKGFFEVDDLKVEIIKEKE